MGQIAKSDHLAFITTHDAHNYYPFDLLFIYTPNSWDSIHNNMKINGDDNTFWSKNHGSPSSSHLGRQPHVPSTSHSPYNIDPPLPFAPGHCDAFIILQMFLLTLSPSRILFIFCFSISPFSRFILHHHLHLQQPTPTIKSKPPTFYFIIITIILFIQH